MRQEKKISVIMGVYNPENREQIVAAIESIIRQSYSNWELIMCDDGSDEVYVDLIREAAKLDSRIRLIRYSQNRGLGYALNTCLEAAEGDYIARMDADDVSEVCRLEKEYDFLENHPEYQWVGTNSNLFDGNGIWGNDKVPETPELKDFLKYSPYIHPTVMFRREVLIEGGRYATSVLAKRCEDYELFMRLHGMGKRGYNIQEPLLNYREDEGTYQRRTLSNRMKESIIRYQGFRKLGILHADTLAYVVRPIVGGMIPSAVIQYYRGNRKKYRVEFTEKQNKAV